MFCQAHVIRQHLLEIHSSLFIFGTNEIWIHTLHHVTYRLCTFVSARERERERKERKPIYCYLFFGPWGKSAPMWTLIPYSRPLFFSLYLLWKFIQSSQINAWRRRFYCLRPRHRQNSNYYQHLLWSSLFIPSCLLARWWWPTSRLSEQSITMRETQFFLHSSLPV